MSLREAREIARDHPFAVHAHGNEREPERSVPRPHIHQTPVYEHSMFIVGGRADNGKSVGLVDVGVFE